jgi:hypothetical protein
LSPNTPKIFCAEEWLEKGLDNVQRTYSTCRGLTVHAVRNAEEWGWRGRLWSWKKRIAGQGIGNSAGKLPQEEEWQSPAFDSWVKDTTGERRNQPSNSSFRG